MQIFCQGFLTQLILTVQCYTHSILWRWWWAFCSKAGPWWHGIGWTTPLRDVDGCGTDFWSSFQAQRRVEYTHSQSCALNWISLANLH